MTPAELASYCQRLCSGNVAEFCRAVGISRDTYYRQTRPGSKVSDQTRWRVTQYMHGDVNRGSNL